MDTSPRPFWWPDMRGFLAFAIVGIIAFLATMVFLRPIQMDQTQMSLASMLLGVLIASFKDVYQWAFGSSQGSDKKGDVQQDMLRHLTNTPATPSPEGAAPAPASSSPPSGAGTAAAIILALVFGWQVLGPAVAHAQVRSPLPLTGDLGKDIKGLAQRNSQADAVPGGSGAPQQLIEKLKALSLADLKYALALAKASNNKITTSCWGAWVDLLTTQQQPLKDDAGNDLQEPNPHLFSDVEKFSELAQSLKQGGTIQVGCAALADAAKKDAVQLVTTFISGGAVLPTLGLPLIP